jgi:hypothetical protein
MEPHLQSKTRQATATRGLNVTLVSTSPATSCMNLTFKQQSRTRQDAQTPHSEPLMDLEAFF